MNLQLWFTVGFRVSGLRGTPNTQSSSLSLKLHPDTKVVAVRETLNSNPKALEALTPEALKGT